MSPHLLNSEHYLANVLRSIKNRYFIKLFLDFAVLLSCAPLAVFLRVNPIYEVKWELILIYFGLAFAPKLMGLKLFNLHRQSWHNISTRDLYRLILAVGTTFIITFLLVLSIRAYFVVPLGVVFIDAMLSILFLSSTRVFARISSEQLMGRRVPSGTEKRVAIVGAGSAGTSIAREMIRHPEHGFVPSVFLDDDTAKHKLRFMDIPVAGTINDLPVVITEYEIDMVLTAIPSTPVAVRRVAEIVSSTKIPHNILPRMSDLLNGNVSMNQIRSVEVEDLLHREAIDLDVDEISNYITGKVVMVTGAGGSIGSEIVRQVCRFSPSHLLIAGRGENSVYQLEQELKNDFPDITYTPFIADVRDKITMERIFSTYHPKIIFHAAAHKHVPLMEQNPEQAVMNNIFGTANLVELALSYDVDRFVNISTDKAVNPTSVMGASKRVAEYVVESGAVRAKKHQHFVSVRFGNVLGSRGSVIPLFKEQIARGGPVTVTSSEMTRYFMTIPEASQLVLQAGGLDYNGAVYVLDMGEPVKIVDLARDLITLSGLEPDKDIKIEFTGMRPGEKLYEEILTAEEGTTSSKYEKIFMARKTKVGINNLDTILAELKYHAEEGNEQAIRRCFHQIIPNFTGWEEEGKKLKAQG